MKNQPKNPLLRYLGGKWRIAPWIIRHFPKHHVYVEPFGGGGSVLLRKPRSAQEIYNDINGDMVNLFRVVRDRGEELAEKVELTPYAREEYYDAYIQSDDPVERARRTLVRAMMGVRSSSATELNERGFRKSYPSEKIDPCRRDWLTMPRRVHAVSERLKGVVIENQDALKLIEFHDSDETLFYVDPPYVFTSRKQTSIGYKHEMTDDDHRALADALHKVKGFVVLSGYESELYNELYSDWHSYSTSTLDFAKNSRKEVLWVNHATLEALGQQGLEFDDDHQ
jgi:DNA adenine methylase